MAKSKSSRGHKSRERRNSGSSVAGAATGTHAVVPGDVVEQLATAAPGDVSALAAVFTVEHVDLAGMARSLFRSVPAMQQLLAGLNPAVTPKALSAECVVCRFLDAMWRRQVDDCRLFAATLIPAMFWYYRVALASGDEAAVRKVGGAEAVLLGMANCSAVEPQQPIIDLSAAVALGSGTKKGTHNKDRLTSDGRTSSAPAGGNVALTRENLAEHERAAVAAASAAADAAGEEPAEWSPLTELSSVVRGAVESVVWREIAQRYPAMPRAYRSTVVSVVGCLAVAGLGDTSALTMPTPHGFTLEHVDISRDIAIHFGVAPLRLAADILLYAAHDTAPWLQQQGRVGLKLLRERADAELDPLLALFVEHAVALGAEHD